MSWRQPDPLGDVFSLVLLGLLACLVVIAVRAIAPR